MSVVLEVILWLMMLAFGSLAIVMVGVFIRGIWRDRPLTRPSVVIVAGWCLLEGLTLPSDPRSWALGLVGGVALNGLLAAPIAKLTANRIDLYPRLRAETITDRVDTLGAAAAGWGTALAGMLVLLGGRCSLTSCRDSAR